MLQVRAEVSQVWQGEEGSVLNGFCLQDRWVVSHLKYIVTVLCSGADSLSVISCHVEG